MRMQVLKFQIVTAIVYFGVAASMGWMALNNDSADANFARLGVGITCSIFGTMVLLGWPFPLRLLAAALFSTTVFSLFMFSGFDESGLTILHKVAITTLSFSAAALYLYLLKRHETALGMQHEISAEMVKITPNANKATDSRP